MANVRPQSCSSQACGTSNDKARVVDRRKMYITGIVYSLLNLLLIKSTVGYPDGAPERACFYMIPRHTHPQSGRPIFKQMGGSPYNITVSSVTYAPNKPLRGEYYSMPVFVHFKRRNWQFKGHFDPNCLHCLNYSSKVFLSKY